jgi:hypothetical protein
MELQKVNPDSTYIYIIIVTFNMLEGLEKTLLSVQCVAVKSKTYTLKAIIINGNPLDEGHVIANKYTDVVFRYLSERDLGIYDAMNKGIALLPDEGYSIFINSDDEIIDIPLMLCESNCDVYFFDVISYDKYSGLKEVFSVKPKRSLNSHNLLRPRVHHQGCFVRNTVLKKYSYDLSVGIRADVLLMGTLLKNHKAGFLNHPVALITTGGISDKNNLTNLLSFFKITNKLGIGKVSTFIFCFPEVLKYLFKCLISSHGVGLFRKIKATIRRCTCTGV